VCPCEPLQLSSRAADVRFSTSKALGQLFSDGKRPCTRIRWVVFARKGNDTDSNKYPGNARIQLGMNNSKATSPAPAHLPPKGRCDSALLPPEPCLKIGGARQDTEVLSKPENPSGSKNGMGASQTVLFPDIPATEKIQNGPKGNGSPHKGQDVHAWYANRIGATSEGAPNQLAKDPGISWQEGKPKIRRFRVASG